MSTPWLDHSASVLVVDDDPAVGKVLGALLAQAGINRITFEMGPRRLPRWRNIRSRW